MTLFLVCVLISILGPLALILWDPANLNPSKKRKPRVIPCPECAVRTYDDNDEPLPPTKGPGCFFCKSLGEVPADMKLPTAFHPTVQDLLDNMKGRKS